MLTAAEIRQQFLDFFASKGNTVVPSAPIVLKNDPSLLFTNAGMNQFKDYFLGNKLAPYNRAVDTQKCLRVSGKHNDLEEVGVDTYHHTMFEMLGNWSFGDYFKREAIEWSWELLTTVYKIPKENLYVTVFEGDEKEGLPPAKIALEKWKELTDESHIVFGNKKDNFWEMGDTGPCGPCSEIHVDGRTEEEKKLIPGRDLVNKDHPQVIEIWNNVFMQFNRIWKDKKNFDEWTLANPKATKEVRALKVIENTKLEPLTSTHVDTGMGFERLVRVLQNKTSNYDTDVFSGTIAEVEKITGIEYDGSDSKQAVAFRVLADHIRAICFTIADGQLPSNTGAGYVIRRILRRAVRYYFTYLNTKQPLLHKLVSVLAIQFENVFPELQKQVDFVSKVVLEEENGFLKTLDSGLKRIDEVMKETTGTVIDGNKAFELFDTFGFPIDLTKLIAAENNLSINEDEFNTALQQQKTRSRSAGIIESDDWVALQDNQSNKFIGYTETDTKTNVVKYRKVKAKGQEGYQIVLAQTPFYAESGGQVGDTGILEFDNEIIEVINTKKENDLIIHMVEKLPMDISLPVIAKINTLQRKATCLHHSATHLLHAALRKVLGTHVAQKGSLVNANNLRFDFSHFAKMTDDELLQVETIVNEKIRENHPVVIKEMPKEEAMKTGAMALFGEKYSDVVRVVIIDPNYSIELCGGTHVGYTGEIGILKLTSETAIAAGVRRIEALCGAVAEKYIGETEKNLSAIATLLKNPKNIGKAIEGLQTENAELKKKLESFEAKLLIGIRNELVANITTINGFNFIGDIIEVSNPDALKKICFDLKNEITAPYAVALCANIGGKAFVAIAFDDESTNKGKDAGAIIKQIVAPLIKGGGGGQKNLATAGGQEVNKLQEVIDKVKEGL